LALILLISLPVKAEAGEVLVNVEIPTQYNSIFQGEAVLIETNIILAKGELDTVTDVFVEYTLKTPQGKAILTFSETKSILLRTNDVKEIRLPSNIIPGIYVLEVKVQSPGNSGGMATATFEVQKIKTKFMDKEFFILATIIFMIFIIFFIALYFIHKKIKRLERLGYKRI